MANEISNDMNSFSTLFHIHENMFCRLCVISLKNIRRVGSKDFTIISIYLESQPKAKLHYVSAMPHLNSIALSKKILKNS